MKTSATWGSAVPVTVTVLLLGSCSVFAQTIAYDNSANDLVARTSVGVGQMIGDEIILGPGLPSHQIFAFDFNYYQVKGLLPGGGASANVHFYLNDGTPFNTYPTPSTEIWSSGWFSVPGTTRDTVYFDQANFGVLTLPNSFTWAVEFAGAASGEEAGLDRYSPPVVGQDLPDYWFNNGSSWELMSGTGFGARFWVVPEPSTALSGLVLGLGSLLLVSRRQRTA